MYKGCVGGVHPGVRLPSTRRTADSARESCLPQLQNVAACVRSLRRDARDNERSSPRSPGTPHDLRERSPIKLQSGPRVGFVQQGLCGGCAPHNPYSLCRSFRICAKANPPYGITTSRSLTVSRGSRRERTKTSDDGTAPARAEWPFQGNDAHP